MPTTRYFDYFARQTTQIRCPLIQIQNPRLVLHCGRLVLVRTARFVSTALLPRARYHALSEDKTGTLNAEAPSTPLKQVAL